MITDLAESLTAIITRQICFLKILYASEHGLVRRISRQIKFNFSM